LSISSIRRELKLKSVDDIISQMKLIRGWRMRNQFRNEGNTYEGPQTRSRVNGNIQVPMTKGTKKVLPCIIKAYNDLPVHIKMVENCTKAKYLIRKFIRI
jgi:hypothetical protein